MGNGPSNTGVLPPSERSIAARRPTRPASTVSAGTTGAPASQTRAAPPIATRSQPVDCPDPTIAGLFLPAAILEAVRSTYCKIFEYVRVRTFQLAHVVIDTFETCMVFCGHEDIWTFVHLFYVISREMLLHRKCNFPGKGIITYIR